MAPPRRKRAGAAPLTRPHSFFFTALRVPRHKHPRLPPASRPSQPWTLACAPAASTTRSTGRPTPVRAAERGWRKNEGANGARGRRPLFSSKASCSPPPRPRTRILTPDTHLTPCAGAPVWNNNNSLTVGPRGELCGGERKRGGAPRTFDWGLARRHPPPHGVVLPRLRRRSRAGAGLASAPHTRPPRPFRPMPVACGRVAWAGKHAPVPRWPGASTVFSMPPERKGHTAAPPPLTRPKPPAHPCHPPTHRPHPAGGLPPGREAGQREFLERESKKRETRERPNDGRPNDGGSAAAPEAARGRVSARPTPPHPLFFFLSLTTPRPAPIV